MARALRPQGGAGERLSRPRRIRLALLVFAFAVLAAAPAAAEFATMTFRVATLETRQCGLRCPEVIVAEGVIEKETPAAFIDFLRSAAGARNLRRVVFFNSPGGNVVASMELGEILRKLGAAGAVGRFGPASDRSGPYSGSCVSACVYAFIGAAPRVVPKGSLIGLHRMSIIERENGGQSGPKETRNFADPAMIAVLTRYTARMGVDPALIRAAESQPADEVHMLTRSEIVRWSLAATRF
jgi:hypothetical protein